MALPRRSHRFLARGARESRREGLFDKQLYHGHTGSMKTAVSLPDRLYEEAEKTAQAMGIPRSQLFAKALEEYIERHRRENITERLDRVYSEAGSDEFEDISNAGLESLRNLTRNDSW